MCIKLIFRRYIPITATTTPDFRVYHSFVTKFHYDILQKVKKTAGYKPYNHKYNILLKYDDDMQYEYVEQMIKVESKENKENIVYI